MNSDYIETKPIKTIPPGCQSNYPCVITSNNIYYAYASTMTINVFSKKNNQIKCILNPKIEKIIKCICFNKSNNNELLSYYDEEILIFSITDEKIIQIYKTPEPRMIDINTDEKILIVTNKDELCYFDMIKKKLDNIKTNGKVITAKWNPFDNNELVYASTDRNIYYVNINNKNKNCSVYLDIKDSFITVIEWYINDENYKYVMVGTSDGYSYLVDISQSIIIISFDKFSNFVTGILWMKHEPGTFMMFSKGTGRATLWNVSKKSYNSLIKISDSPILRYNYLDETKILLSLLNGEIIIYDVKNSKIDFKLEAGHSETIFHLSFNHNINGQLATCGYDSSIKIWNINENKLIYNMRVDVMTNTEKVAIYCLKWSPSEKELLLSGDEKGELKLWDVSKQKLLSTLKLTIKNEIVYCIDWINRSNENTIAASCSDCIFISRYSLFKLNLLKFIKTSSQVNLIAYDYFSPNIAVGCNDTTIKIYTYMEKNQPPIVLSGHTGKVFGVLYNHKRKNILASSSDDNKVGIWNIETKTPKFLAGHNNKVRHLTWLSDYDYILISGSWDGTIRFWNIESLCCIGSINENYSDVYGVSISPFHPFLLASVSRDNSIRFWNILTSQSDILYYITQLENKPDFKQHPYLNEILSYKSIDYIDMCDLISNYFWYHEGLPDLWEIVRVITKTKTQSELFYRNIYIMDLYSVYKSKIQQNEFDYFSNKLEYSRKKEDILTEAIKLASIVGDWEKFCELSIEAGDWDKAIMAAPHVSLSYWKDLLNRHNEFLKNNNNKDKMITALLCNQIQPALNYFLEDKEYDNAKVLWLTRKFGNKLIESERMYNDLDFLNIEKELNKINEELNKITDLNFKELIHKGHSIEAVCSFLSIKDLYNTFKTLIRTNEIEIAYLLMKVFKYKVFEEDIIIGLALKELNKCNYDNYFLLCKLTDNYEIWIFLIELIKSYKGIKDPYSLSGIDKEIIISLSSNDNGIVNLIANNEYIVAFSYFENTFNKFADILRNGNFDIVMFSNLCKTLRYIRCISLKYLESSKKDRIYFKILLTASVIDTFNKNLKSCIVNLYEISKVLPKISSIEENEKIFISFSSSYYNNEKKKDDSDYKLDKFVIDMGSFYKRQDAISKDFANCGDLSVTKYHCNDLGKYYFIREEIHPVNINLASISTLNGKIIKGKPVIINKVKLSKSQALELFKNSSCIPSSLDDSLDIFIP